MQSSTSEKIESLRMSNNNIPIHYDFSINPNLSIDIIYVGKEQEPIIIVDNLLQIPETIELR